MILVISYLRYLHQAVQQHRNISITKSSEWDTISRCLVIKNLANRFSDISVWRYLYTLYYFNYFSAFLILEAF